MYNSIGYNKKYGLLEGVHAETLVHAGSVR